MSTSTDIQGADPRVVEGVKNAVEVCLGVQPGERTAVVAEKGMEWLAEPFAQAMDEAGADVQTFLVDAERCADRAASAEVVARLRTSDASVMMCTVQGIPSSFRRLVTQTGGTAATRTCRGSRAR